MKIYKVYIIRQRSDDKIVYVGLTRQTIHKRFLGHVGRKRVKHGVHYINLVQDHLTLEQAVALEKMLISQYNTIQDGLNKSPGSINGYSNYHTEEQKQKWSRERKGIKVSEEHAAKNKVAKLGIKNSKKWHQKMAEVKSKPVICLNTGITFNSMKEAAQKMGLDRRKIGLVCNGIRPHTRGYIFKFCL